MTALDEFVGYAKRNPPHGIVLVLAAKKDLTVDVKYVLMAMRECFKKMLSESRLIVYVKNLPSALTLEEEGIEDEAEQVERQAAKAREVADKAVYYILGAEHLQGYQNLVKHVEEILVIFEGVLKQWYQKDNKV